MNGCTYSTFCGKEVESIEGQTEDATVAGVFAPLVDNAAFIDKLVLGIHGKLRKRPSKKFTKTKNLAIWSPRGPYARSIHETYEPTWNPLEVKYGRNPVYRNLFPAKLTVRSEGAPVSFPEVTEILDGRFRKGHRSVLTGIEFTCDVSVPFQYFENHILTRARSVRTLQDDSGWQTFYAGAPGAPWMLRIYQKTRRTTRVEFVLRQAFLAKAGIHELAGLGALREFSWNRLVQFPAVCQRALEELVGGKAPAKQLKLILEWPSRRPTGILLEVLRDYGLPANQILRPSAVEQLMAKMQKAFVWGNGRVEGSR